MNAQTQSERARYARAELEHIISSLRFEALCDMVQRGRHLLAREEEHEVTRARCAPPY